MRPELRDEFPQLQRALDGQPLCYLDSAATSLKPRAVLDAERSYSEQFCSNIHRGKHLLSEEASSAYEEARRKVAAFLDVAPQGVLFTRNTTEALNQVAMGLRLSKDDVVVTQVNEHHSNLVPWMRVAQTRLFPCSPTRPIDVDAFTAFLKQHRPKVVTLGHASNVTGVVQPIEALFAAARDVGAITVLDAAQSAPHRPLRPLELPCDFVAWSGHKLLGPSGTGVLWGRKEALEALEPLIVGGGTVDRVTEDGYRLKKAPYAFEAGTPNISGVIGLGAAIDFLSSLGMEEVSAHEERLASTLAREFSSIPGMKLLHAEEGPRLAVGTLVPEQPHLIPDELARIMSDGHQTMLRSGFFCAHPLFDALGATRGGLRVSAYVYNTLEELSACAENLRRVLVRWVR